METFHLASDIALTHGLQGGCILALSCSTFMLFTGKVTGISGISSGLVLADGEDWHFAYITGLLSAGMVLKQVYPAAFGSIDASQLSLPVLITAGVLVGFGTKLSSGCTSGHGLMGLSRFSPRSLAAVMTFMGVGAVTASIAQFPSIQGLLHGSTDISGLSYPYLLLPTALLVATTVVCQKSHTGLLRGDCRKSVSFTALGAGLLFGLGLGLSGMCSPARVLGFLAPFGPKGWDPSLTAVMGGGVTLLTLAWQWMKRSNAVSPLDSKPVCDCLQIGCTPANMKIDARLLTGAALFGAGWGLAGICPGPAWVSLGAGGPAMAVFIPSMLAGFLLKDALVK